MPYPCEKQEKWKSTISLKPIWFLCNLKAVSGLQTAVVLFTSAAIWRSAFVRPVELEVADGPAATGGPRLIGESEPLTKWCGKSVLFSASLRMGTDFLQVSRGSQPQEVKICNECLENCSSCILDPVSKRSWRRSEVYSGGIFIQVPDIYFFRTWSFWDIRLGQENQTTDSTWRASHCQNTVWNVCWEFSVQLLDSQRTCLPLCLCYCTAVLPWNNVSQDLFLDQWQKSPNNPFKLFCWPNEGLTLP